jgi:hypothetical protein
MRNASESRNPLQDVATGARAVGLGVAMGLIVYAADEAEIALHEPPAVEPPVAVAKAPDAVATTSVPARPVYLPLRMKEDTLASVPVYLQSQFKAAAPIAEPIPTF